MLRGWLSSQTLVVLSLERKLALAVARNCFVEMIRIISESTNVFNRQMAYRDARVTRKLSGLRETQLQPVFDRCAFVFMFMHDQIKASGEIPVSRLQRNKFVLSKSRFKSQA